MANQKVLFFAASIWMPRSEYVSLIGAGDRLRASYTSPAKRRPPRDSQDAKRKRDLQSH
jgi:hypothetical protein